VLGPERFDLNGKVVGSKGEKEPEGIPISLDSVFSYPFYTGKILIEKAMNASRKFHISFWAEMAKLTRP
jgi:hypothetical protein